MTFIVQKVKTGITCPGELVDEINNDVGIVTNCEDVRIDDGDQVNLTFDGSGPLSGAEDTALDTLLAGFVCPGAGNNDEPATSGENFGADYLYVQEDQWSTTTSSNYQRKIRLTTTDLVPGLYRVGWHYRWTSSSTSIDFSGRVRLNDTIVLMDHVQEPQDSSTNQKHHCSGFNVVSLSGINTVDIDYRELNGGTAYIAEARLDLWRVGDDTTITPTNVPGDRTASGGDD